MWIKSKRTAILSLAVVIAALAALLFLWSAGDSQTIQRLNENSSLPVALATPEEQALAVLTESLLYVPGFGQYALNNDDICIYIGGWPDVGDTYHVTRIDLFSPGYHVLGLQVGDGAAKADETLSNYGYDCRTEDGYRVYTNGPVTVVAYVENHLLTRINLSLQTTNKNDLVF